jgi:hypothetical protein
MRGKRLLTVAAFAFLIAAGTVTAGVVAGQGPASVQQTVSTATTGSTTGTTATTATGTTATTTTVATTTTTTTTTTTPRKIRICHHARTKSGFVKHVTIRINRSAWNAHQRHGDSIGACNTASAKKFHSRPAHIKRFHKRGK